MTVVLLKIAKKTAIFLGTFLLYHIIFSNFFPADENNVLIAPDWYVYLGFAVAICASWRKEIVAKISTAMQNRKKAFEESIEPIIQERIITEDMEPTIPPEPRHVPSEMELVDAMEGHAFEYWCADLLRKNGFANVSVTRGSGDQGVDVLAEKDGIRYAVQCKCYSKDLGNTPVQEVSAGKVFYHCQIGAVLTNRYFTKGAKELAESTGILLWDRDWIKSHL